MKILIMGLPGSGKTTLANILAKKLNAVHFNADEIRANINKDLRFSKEDRLEQSRRMGWLADQVNKTNQYVICDFVCPTEETRKIFGKCFTIWMDTIKQSIWIDTNNIFEEPENPDFYINSFDAEYNSDQIIEKLHKKVIFDNKKPSTLMIGRFQPFHSNDKALFKESLKRTGQVIIQVIDIDINEKNPFNFALTKKYIDNALMEYEGKYIVIKVPNITNICYSKDVGYKIEEINLP